MSLILLLHKCYGKPWLKQTIHINILMFVNQQIIDTQAYIVQKTYICQYNH